MRVTGFAIVFLAVLITLGQQTILTRADHADGNIATCGSVPCSVNYWLVDEGQLRVCDDSSRVSTDVLNSAIGIWNSGAPDGVIHLLNDQLGVISQYHPGPC